MQALDWVRSLDDCSGDYLQHFAAIDRDARIGYRLRMEFDKHNLWDERCICELCNVYRALTVPAALKGEA